MPHSAHVVDSRFFWPKSRNSCSSLRFLGILVGDDGTLRVLLVCLLGDPERCCFEGDDGGVERPRSWRSGLLGSEESEDVREMLGRGVVEVRRAGA